VARRRGARLAQTAAAPAARAAVGGARGGLMPQACLAFAATLSHAAFSLPLGHALHPWHLRESPPPFLAPSPLHHVRARLPSLRRPTSTPRSRPPRSSPRRAPAGCGSSGWQTSQPLRPRAPRAPGARTRARRSSSARTGRPSTRGAAGTSGTATRGRPRATGSRGARAAAGGAPPAPLGLRARAALAWGAARFVGRGFGGLLWILVEKDGLYAPAMQSAPQEAAGQRC
jgi:hypothetical protein